MDIEREYYDRQQIREILIIEDDKDINDLLATALSKAGYRTRQAWSGTEGELLLKLDREAYALVLLDLMLPGFQGGASGMIRQMDASLPVIILTAKDELDEKINLLVAGADDYITKPFEIKEVVARVAVQLRHAVADVPSKSGQAGKTRQKQKMIPDREILQIHT
ncbi:MAG: response regulator transcription factor [Agathobacter rectalis]